MPDTSQVNATVAILDLAAIRVQETRGPQSASTQVSPFQRFQGLTLLEWCVRRLEECTLLDTIVVTGSPSQKEQVLAGSLCGARWMPSPSGSPAIRAMQVAERTNSQWMVFVSPTCPFVDPTLLDRLIAAAWSHPEADYLGFRAVNRSISLGSLGLVGEMCSRSALTRLAQDDDPTMTVPHQLKCAPETFQMRLLPLPTELERAELRFNLESAADWDRAYSLLEAVGDDVSWHKLASLSAKVPI